jgi:plasmid replication initiation protein
MSDPYTKNTKGIINDMKCSITETPQFTIDDLKMTNIPPEYKKTTAGKMKFKIFYKKINM